MAVVFAVFVALRFERVPSLRSALSLGAKQGGRVSLRGVSLSPSALLALVNTV